MDDPVVIVTEHTREHLSTVEEFAAELRVHPKSVYRWIRADKLKGVVHVGGLIRINKNEALGWSSAHAHVQRVP
jgi:hypothetical protein